MIFLGSHNKTEKSSDDSVMLISKMILPKYVPGPYTSTSTSPTSTNATAVPSLLSFCIRALLKYPDQLGSIHQRRLAYKHSPTSRAALQSLIPHFNPDTPDDLDLSLVDPRLWACLVQIFRDLPPCFHRYSAPLSDEYMPIIQKVQQSEVTLLTVLDLQRCRELSDESVVNLKALHSLCCLDASDSSLTSYGIKTLSATLVRNGGIRRGPWGLRILRLRGCSAMDNNIFGYLKKFRLLSILGTISCSSLNDHISDAHIGRYSRDQMYEDYTNAPIRFMCSQRILPSSIHRCCLGRVAGHVSRRSATLAEQLSHPHRLPASQRAAPP